MKNNPTETKPIEIFSKTYQIQCADTELELLQRAAQYVDEQMQLIRDAGNILNFDRIAVTAALNIAYQLLLTEKEHHQQLQVNQQQLRELQKKVDGALAANSQMELPSE